MIKQSRHLRTLLKCGKHSPVLSSFPSIVFSNTRCVLSQCNTRLRLLYLLNVSRASAKPISKYTPISKNVVGENGEWQLSNGNCTTERNCGFHIWYAKTMSSSRGAKLGSLSNLDDDGNKSPPKFAYLTMKNNIFVRFARAFSSFDILKTFSFFL